MVVLAIPMGAIQIYLLPQPHSHPFVDISTTLAPEAFLTMAAVTLVGGLPFSLVVPSLKAGLFVTGLPQDTYLVPRFALRLLCSLGYGFSLGGLLVLPLVPSYVWPFVVAVVLQAAVLGYSTRQRFRQSPKCEWVAPNPWYKVLRPIIRGSRPDA